jgi:hypothetical protein
MSTFTMNLVFLAPEAGNVGLEEKKEKKGRIH